MRGVIHHNHEELVCGPSDRIIRLIDILLPEPHMLPEGDTGLMFKVSWVDRVLLLRPARSPRTSRVRFGA